MLTLTMDIPDYDSELERLSGAPGQETIDPAVKLSSPNFLDFHLPPALMDVLQIVAWVVIVCLVAWFVYREFFLLSRVSVIEEKALDLDFDDVLQGSAEDADYRSHDLDEELHLALSNGDFSKAIHLRYLMALKHLDDCQLIDWQPYKTPLMYVSELSKGKSQLESLTKSFLYIKYGHYPANQQVYDELMKDYEWLVLMRKEVAYE